MNKKFFLNMTTVIIILLVVIVGLCIFGIISVWEQTTELSFEESNIYAKPENSLANDFIKLDSEDVAENIYNKLTNEHIYCEYGQSDGHDHVVYFKNSGYSTDDKSWIEVDLPQRIILHNPDPDYLKIYFNRIVPLWDNQTKGNQIIAGLRSKTYENDDGYRYNIIEVNNVKYHIYYDFKNRYKIDDVYIVFQADENSNAEET